MKRSVGPNPTSRLSHHGALVVSGFALTTTLLPLEQLRRAPSCRRTPGSRSGTASTPSTRRSLGLLSNVPWIAVPFEVIEATWPSVTCCRKNGLYGTRMRDAGLVAREPTQ